MKEFNGYAFDDQATRRRIRYVVIKGGDLDAYLDDEAGQLYRTVQAVFKVQDITRETKL